MVAVRKKSCTYIPVATLQIEGKQDDYIRQEALAHSQLGREERTLLTVRPGVS